MKTTVSTLKQLFEKLFSEDIDREQRAKQGYDGEDEGSGVNYNDLPENIEITQEDDDRLRRNLDKYGDDMEESPLMKLLPLGKAMTSMDGSEEEGIPEDSVPMALRAKLHPKPRTGPVLNIIDLDLDDDEMDDAMERDMEEVRRESKMPSFRKILASKKR